MNVISFRKSFPFFLSLFLHIFILTNFPAIYKNKISGTQTIRLGIREKEKIIPPLPAPATEIEKPKKIKKTIPKIPSKEIIPEMPQPPPLPQTEPLPEIIKPGLPQESLATEGSGVSIPVGNIPEGIIEKGEVIPSPSMPIIKEVETKTEAPPIPIAPTAPPKPNYVPLFTVTQMPSFKIQIKPEYPLQAKKMGKEGSVLMEVSISKTGEVLEIEIIKSSGYGFDEAAKEAMLKSVFSPAKINDQAVDVKLRIPINFKFKE